MNIAIGSDHAGFLVKEKIKGLLTQKGHSFRDFGTDTQVSCDYPDFALPVALAVGKGVMDRGILICGTGIGMSIVANKIEGVRAALCASEETALLSREHNDANIICLGSRTNPVEAIEQIVDIWLNTPFSQGRHSTRIEKIKTIEAQSKRLE